MAFAYTTTIKLRRPADASTPLCETYCQVYAELSGSSVGFSKMLASGYDIEFRDAGGVLCPQFRQLFDQANGGDDHRQLRRRRGG
jgi:hypothetical protein